MPMYESVFIARQDIATTQVDGLADQFSGVVSEKGGEVKKRENWGLKTLAYRIKKNRKGHYVMLAFDAPSEVVRELERQMNLNEDVLRHMTIRVDEIDDEPTVMMSGKSGWTSMKGGKKKR